MPFMFLGAITDFVFPDVIGRIANALKDKNEPMIDEILWYWMGLMLASGASACVRDVLFGMTSERLGTSLRLTLFKALIKKDVTFYDENQTGDILSRLSNDTQVVQEGLT